MTKESILSQYRNSRLSKIHNDSILKENLKFSTSFKYQVSVTSNEYIVFGYLGYQHIKKTLEPFALLLSTHHMFFSLTQNPPKLKESVSVANNACWAIGELALKVCLHTAQQGYMALVILDFWLEVAGCNFCNQTV